MAGKFIIVSKINRQNQLRNDGGFITTGISVLGYASPCVLKERLNNCI
jgi:hypothetical protein